MKSIIRGADNFDSADTYTQPTSIGAVGTYMLARASSGGSSNVTYYGVTWAGSSIEACNVGLQGQVYSQSGTWRVMGTFFWAGSSQGYISVWLRIA